MTHKPSPPPPGLEATRFLNADVRDKMRAEIAKVNGDEVFFIGVVSEKGMVEHVEACAWGNENAVPVVDRLARAGDVVIHNHPGGDLRPSDADLEVAAHMADRAVGSYIVDNEVSRVREVVKYMRAKERQPLDTERLEEILEPDGTLARSMQDYEHRPEQCQMLRAVANAFNNDGIAVIEAGTGTGKSLAYLLPAIHWAKANGEKVVVSTNTINLQEQIVAKDMPFLAKHIGLEFKSELMKGRNNYLCKRKAEFLQSTPDFFGGDQTETQLQAILQWTAKTQTGDMGELSFVPEMDAWERVSSDADNCTRTKCRHFAKCWFFEARRRAASADIIVANHHLVMADLAVRMETNNYTTTAVLPPYKRLIFDEAHNIEDVATNYFGIQITRRTLSRLLSRLVHRERSNLGLLPFLRERLVMLEYQHPSEQLQKARILIDDTLIPLRMEVAQVLRSLMDMCVQDVCDILNETLQPRKELKLRITPNIENTKFWDIRLRDAIQKSTNLMLRMSRGMLDVYTLMGKLPEERREELDNPMGELKALARRLSSRVDQFKNFHTIGENQCRWIEIYCPTSRDTAPAVKLVSLPLEVRGHLNKAVYAKTPTVVMTSATLSVAKRFDFFLGQVGLNAEFCAPDILKRVETLQLDTPFDYDRQAFVGVPIDIPEPREGTFLEAAVNMLLPAINITRGSAFILFTSYQQLNQFYGKMAPVLQQLGYNCLKQGVENRQTLLQRFKNDRTSILFATSSFWEGVDVPGDALKLLVIAKLPFRVPTDPLVQARVEKLEAQGQDSFSQYSVPQAAIRFKQGFGRLIRTRDDMGAVLVMDNRVATKRYGSVFLDSLPSGTVHCKPWHKLLDDMENFFR